LLIRKRNLKIKMMNLRESLLKKKGCYKSFGKSLKS